MITSTSNPKVKQLQLWQNKSKERKKDGVYIVEGIKMFLEAPIDMIKEVYISQEILQNVQKESESNIFLKEKIQLIEFETITDDIFKKVSDTQTPQGILTVMKRPEYSMDDIAGTENPLVVVLENLQDPGNLGTILRTGEGAGISGVIMSEGTVDIYNPKTIRATMGSIYRIPFIYTKDLAETIGELKERGIKTYAAHLKGETYYDSLSFKEPTAFLIGNEGNGLTDRTAGLADSYLKIPMEGQVESLNAAVATSLLIYETHRQRSLK